MSKSRPTREENKKPSSQIATSKITVKEVSIGVGKKKIKIGGQRVLDNHGIPTLNPTAIAIDISDDLSDDEVQTRTKGIAGFSFDFQNRKLRLHMIAIRSESGDPQKFGATVRKVTENASLPLILCSLQPEVLKAGLDVAGKERPLLYAATKENWSDIVELAKTHDCPLAVSAPGDLATLKSFTKKLLRSGVQELVLDPGTFPGVGLNVTLNNFVKIRKAAGERGGEVFAFPLLGVPMMAWIGRSEILSEIAAWREACLAATLLVGYADVLILHSLLGWSLLPITILNDEFHTSPKGPLT